MTHDPDDPDVAPPPPSIVVRVRNGGRAGAMFTAAFWLVVIGLWAVTLVGRGISAPPGWMAAAVTFLPYLYGFVLIGGFLLWTALPDRRSLPVVLGAVLVAAAGLWGPSWASRARVDEGQQVRVMTWNLRRLWGGPSDGGDPTKCAVATIQDAQPDVLTLLEVSANDIERLQRAINLSCVHHPYREGNGPKNGGLATCVRAPWVLKSGSGLRFVDTEDWFYVAAEVEANEQVFNVVAVHLTPYDYAARRLQTGVRELATGSTETLAALERSGQQVVKGQSDQAAALLARVQRFKHPTVVAGDFNSTRDAALHLELRRTLTDVWERGGQGFGGTIDFADWVPLRIDYVYTTDAFTVGEAQVLAVGCSDHRPVVVDLGLSVP